MTSCFFVPSLRPSYIGETVLNPCHSVGCEDFSEIVVSSLFLFDFDSILFVLYCARKDISLVRAYLHAVCWILTTLTKIPHDLIHMCEIEHVNLEHVIFHM